MKFVEFAETAKETLEQHGWLEFSRYIDGIFDADTGGTADFEDFEILDVCHFYDDVEDARIEYGTEYAISRIARFART